MSSQAEKTATSLNGFVYQPLDEPSLIRRVIRGGFSDNAFREIRNRLATGPVTALSELDVADMLERYELSRAEAHASFAGIYRSLLGHRTTDRHLSSQDRADLAHLRRVLALSDEDVVAVEADVLGALLRAALTEAFADRRLSEREREGLRQMTANFDLPEDVVRRIYADEAAKALQFVHDVGSSGEQTDLDALERLAHEAGVEVGAPHDDATRRERRRELADIRAGSLPEVDATGVATLLEGETGHARAEGTLTMPAPATDDPRSAAADGQWLKGVQLRFGRVSPRPPGRPASATGLTAVMLVTSRRVIFAAADRSIDIPLTDITGFTLFDTALRLDLSTGQRHLFDTRADLPRLATILDVSLARAIEPSPAGQP